MISNFKLPNPFKTDLDLYYFVKDTLEGDDIKADQLQPQKIYFLNGDGPITQKHLDEIKDTPYFSYFSFKNYTINDIRVYKSSGFGESFEIIRFKLTEPYKSHEKEFEIRTVIHNYMNVLLYIKFIINYYHYTGLSTDNLTNECLSTDLFFIYNQDIDTILKDLSFSSFDTTTNLFTICISNFYDQYTLNIVENCIVAGIGTEFFNFYFDSLERKENRIIFYNTNRHFLFFKAKILFHLKKFYNVENHIRYVLIKHGCV